MRVYLRIYYISRGKYENMLIYIFGSVGFQFLESKTEPNRSIFLGKKKTKIFGFKLVFRFFCSILR